MPKAVFANKKGEIFDHPVFEACGRTGNKIVIPDSNDWIKSPYETDFFVLPTGPFPPLPAPSAVEGTKGGEGGFFAVAAFLPPGYVRLYLPAAMKNAEKKSILPQFAYCSAGWKNGKFYVTAEKVDYDPFWDPANRDFDKIEKAVESFRHANRKKNRLISHLSRCAVKYNCYTAQNIFLGQGEGGIPVSPSCNARCAGCISFQPDKDCPSSHRRISFAPTVEEIAKIAVPHLKNADKPIISFGQGCEGEPTLQKKLLIDAIGEIRKTTDRGTIHVNTNGSNPQTIKELARAGLNSIRISMNSADETLYQKYYRPKGYTFSDVVESLKTAKRSGLFVSINLLVFPGINDRKSEVTTLLRLIKRIKPDLIQMRNLNIDPDVYMKIAGDSEEECIGLKKLIKIIKDSGTTVGYFNRPTLFPPP